MAVLNVQGLRKEFGKLAALNDVTFTVEGGEIFGIAGPNGAGKSTLFNVISGVYRPSAGKVFYRGRDITGLSPHLVCRAGLARTFQVPVVFQSLTVFENIRVGSVFGSGNRRLARDIVQFLGLQRCAHAPARNLDLYTTKLVMLGSALATGCALLMLDEPMAGFSAVEVRSFADLLRRLQRDWGITILIVEHLVDVLLSLATTVMILQNGQVLYLGSPEGVKRDEAVARVYLGVAREDLVCSK
jgi:branched-chain amino acid transport system ATP-binding protein